MAETSGARRKYEALKHQLLGLGYARPGSLVRRFMRCGKPGCHCMAEGAAWSLLRLDVQAAWENDRDPVN